jgi:DNA-binding LacI/PurR family transcriptional regulator
MGVTKTVTIRDVARRAGVSVATASRVLNRYELVNGETRSRVLAAMDELKFTPSHAARRLSLGRTLTVSVVVTFLTRPQAAERLRGIDALLSDSEFDLVIYNVETVEKRDQYLRSLPVAQRTDGLLVVSLPPSDEETAVLAAASIPVVVIDAHAPGLELLPRVVGDDILGGELASRHLLELGHRRIGFVGDAFENPFGFTSGRDRYAGYEKALASAGVPVPADLVALGAHGRYEARELAMRLLSSAEPPTAILASSDTQALGVMAAARELGLGIPDDLSVIGYDDIEAADYVGLTTVRQQLFESGRQGAELLLKEIEERSAVPPLVTLDPSVVIRATTAPPKGGPRLA